MDGRRRARLFWGLLLFRLANAVLVRTYYVPDEYWQAVEPAHALVFPEHHQHHPHHHQHHHPAGGDSGLTWEWRAGLRSYLHPLLFAFPMAVLKLAGSDSRLLVGLAPRVVSAVVAALGDLGAIVLAGRLATVGRGLAAARTTDDGGGDTGEAEDRDGEGGRAEQGALFLVVTSWYLFYAGVRPLSNCAEAVLTVWALAMFPWNSRAALIDEGPAWILAGLACVVRPTAALFWGALGVGLGVWPRLAPAATRGQRVVGAAIATGLRLGLLVVPIGAMLCALQASVDWLVTSRWTLVPINFVRFNLISGAARFYGTHPWHWYVFGEGLTGILGAAAPLAAVGLWQTRRRQPVLVLAVVATVAALSAVPHKEHRFMLVVLYPLFAVSGRVLGALRLGRPGLARALCAIVVVVSVPVAVYLSAVHQRGPVDAVDTLVAAATNITNEHGGARPVTAALLMPCHSLPGPGTFHMASLQVRSLDCSPPNEVVGGGAWPSGWVEQVDEEAGRFFASPRAWVDAEWPSCAGAPDLVAAFAPVGAALAPWLERCGYAMIADLFHAHLEVDARCAGGLGIYQRRHGA